ncbi:hypothetical protein [uncultured Treponema sp.]|uniref:hypothetical protein n=1 Tax=uncultured Treponema sp. TaxID=162155 RepID=UPI0025E559F9|nr:hypothetical protein [uncultured Treponema sp.]
MNEQKTEFTAVDINDFFDSNEQPPSAEIDTGIVVFTEHQRQLVHTMRDMLAGENASQLEPLNKRIDDLKKLAIAIATFPSLLERADLTGGTRTPDSLIDSLINSNREGDTTLQLPSKATLGKGFLVAKLHTFSSLEKIARKANLEPSFTQKIHDETISMMFLLLAEDVYLNLIRDTSLTIENRRQLALALLLLWEHRADQNIYDISPVLQSVWNARRRLAPAFGTMMGTSELIMISFQLDEQWSQFIKTKLGEQGVNQAMEEFLFGISYEQITKLKLMLRERGIAAIGRDEVSTFLGTDIKTNVSEDYRDFFQQYSLRRDNARARKRLDLPGPHKTLEDYFISFVMEMNREKQEKDLHKHENFSENKAVIA